MSSAQEADRGPRHAAGYAEQAVQRARHAASTARQVAASRAQRAQSERELFAQPVQDYLYQALGRPLAVLRAGCQTPVGELGLERLRDSGYRIIVTSVDQDSPLTRAVLADPVSRNLLSAGPGPVLLGDLRSVALPPRSFDVVYSAFLLERIGNAALVLDRFVGALRPGGLLLLRVRDRDCAAAVLDRSVPERLRRALWARLHPGEPGPWPAVYDPLTSARGLTAYAAAHGLVVVAQETGRTVPEAPARLAAAVRAARLLVGWLSRNQRTDGHDELLYVIRKPEDRFARLL
ncbi:MAG: methyltransferase domain-containing protein [Actinobacteria bacterium]|nr:methyltransferase domain-containing protein [Actinomycetota bacterium]